MAALGGGDGGGAVGAVSSERTGRTGTSAALVPLSPPIAWRRAAARARASPKRASGSRAMARWTTWARLRGTSLRSEMRGGGSSMTMAAMTAAALGPSKGRRPPRAS